LTELQHSIATSDTEWLDKILAAHPRLGEKKVNSAQSRGEQAGLNTGGEEEAEQLRDLNREYEEKFPGLRYV
jgi:2-oxo-4-hydroxy-4-carboxy--5-ureidoimidazoline (OHCU) decarboxylase